MVDLLFAYGTLRTAFQPLNELLGPDTYRLVGEGTIQGRKLEGTPYPAVVKDSDGGRISGELIQLFHIQDAIEKLDTYEDYHPKQPAHSLYVRELTTVTLNDGTTREAWVYYYNTARSIH